MLTASPRWQYRHLLIRQRFVVDPYKTACSMMWQHGLRLTQSSRGRYTNYGRPGVLSWLWGVEVCIRGQSGFLILPWGHGEGHGVHGQNSWWKTRIFRYYVTLISRNDVRWSPAWSILSPGIRNNTKMSSAQTRINCNLNSIRENFITLWDVPWAFTIQNPVCKAGGGVVIRKRLLLPSFSAILIWHYPLFVSKVENILA